MTNSSDQGPSRNIVIPQNCINRQITLITNDNQRISFFAVASNASTNQPFVYGYIYVRDYSGSDCPTPGAPRRLFTPQCLNQWRRLNIKTGGTIWFFPTDLSQEQTYGVIAGWIYTPDFREVICQPPTPTPPPPTGELNVSGAWRTTRGRMTLRQRRSAIDGTYFNRDTAQYGTLEGTLRDNRFTGRWFEQNRSGRVVFIFSADRNSFQGRYGMGDEAPDRQWDGSRIR